MSDRQDAARAKVEADRRKRANLYFNYPGPWEFFFSEAGRAITKSHPSAIVAYLHVIARQPLPPKKRERTRLEKLGLWPPKKPKEFSFPVEEGPFHGIGKKATASGLRILHEVGAINRVRSGSATRGDFAMYVVSERWRLWQPPDGGPAFEYLEWKKADMPWLEEEKRGKRSLLKVRDERGRYLPRRGRKVLVAALGETIKPSLVAPKDTREKPLVSPKAMNKASDTEPLVAPKSIFLYEPILQEKTKRSEDQGAGHRDRCVATTSSPRRPPKSEIRENVAEILRKRPDHGVNDSRFVRFLTDQLQDVQSGRLDAGRVHRDLHERHGVDAWTIDLMFAVSTIGIPTFAEVGH